MIFDIDHFKDINDQRGHLDGDLVLREVAKLLKQEAREVDLVARYGGDEFIILMPQTGLEGAMVMAERVRLKVEQTMSFTISGGVASAKKDDTPVALLLRGDGALYSAKVAGRNRVFCHDGDGRQDGGQAPPVPPDGSPPCARWPSPSHSRCASSSALRRWQSVRVACDHRFLPSWRAPPDGHLALAMLSGNSA